jgi:hypothetical protein
MSSLPSALTSTEATRTPPVKAELTAKNEESWVAETPSKTLTLGPPPAPAPVMTWALAVPSTWPAAT